MSKNICTNKEMINEEVVFLMGRLRNAIAFNGRDRVPVYLAGVHKEAIDAIKSMGVKVDEKKGRWTIELYAPKKGTKAWENLFKGSKVIDMAKAEKDAKEKAAAAAAKEKADKKAAKAKAKAEKEKAAAKAAKEKAKAAKDAPKAEKKVAAPKAAKKSATSKVEAAAKAEKPKAEKKAKTEKKAAAPKAAKKATKKVTAPKADAPAETKAE